ncbi:hypothetical protein CVT25_004242 [Psilocybe cyanescens]|uniref:F-box domain-containing protein n=1 Tax=Psilocybe cyanescens TaxID=93625 RepID=A0A409VS09_PSICY|nr:hypothetical protein CVT25_004242 [Psilocybe cyanescens]
MLARSPFVNDLIPLILDANHNWWTRDYVVLSSVSSPWLYHTRKRLYPCPTVYSFRAAVLLAATLSGSPLLASLVEGISLQPIIQDLQSHRPQPAELRALRYLLGLEGLHRIALGGELAVKAERFLRLIANPDEVEELHIDGSIISHRLSSSASLEWDESLAFGFPSLNKLRLTHIELDIIPPSMPYITSITQLILDNIHIIDGYLLNLVNGAKSLDRLHVTTSDPDVFGEELRLVLTSCAVRCLHYEAQKVNKADPFVVHIVPTNAASLRCLHLHGLFVDLAVLTVVNDICLNLVELTISGRAMRISPQEWADFIRSGAFSSLQRLSLPWGTNGPPFLTWPESDIKNIQEACASRTISLSLR